ncbi:MAG: hypothetical protein KA885_00080 [Spirochaetes bacterium]|nr:hypothetical protein [Spirochaetota bacterium]
MFNKNIYQIYFIIYPDGEEQEIFNPLNFGDIVDVNGNLYEMKDLDPHKIAYKVVGCKRSDYFKESTWRYKLEILNRDQVIDEIGYRNTVEYKEKLDEIYKKIEKRILKKKKRTR